MSKAPKRKTRTYRRRDNATTTHEFAQEVASRVIETLLTTLVMGRLQLRNMQREREQSEQRKGRRG